MIFRQLYKKESLGRKDVSQGNLITHRIKIQRFPNAHDIPSNDIARVCLNRLWGPHWYFICSYFKLLDAFSISKFCDFIPTQGASSPSLEYGKMYLYPPFDTFHTEVVLAINNGFGRCLHTNWTFLCDFLCVLVPCHFVISRSL